MAPTLGFVCVWDPDRASTWSHIPANLLAALERLTCVVDIEAEPGRLIRRVHHKQNRSAHQPDWTPQPWNNVWRRASVARQLLRERPAAALQINELTTTSVPYWVYRDMTWAQVEEYGGDTATGVISPASVRRAMRHERRVYERSRGVFTFSRWAAESVERMSDVPVIVVPPGINVRAPERQPGKSTPRNRLLFVGRAFHRKGGVQLVRAFDLLRATRPDLRLDVVGPDRWPDDLEQPPGVTFHGPLSTDGTAALFHDADLFVMPSAFEAYGIALLEALAAGVPCVARRVCAMPEILRDGELGVLVGSGDAPDLARCIDQALDDDALHRRVAAASRSIRDEYTWDRAAARMLAVIETDLGHLATSPGAGPAGG